MTLEYDEQPDDLAARIRAHREFSSLRLEDVLRERLSGPTRRRVLDVGCGSGNFTRLLAASCRTYVGLDRNPALLRHASQSKRPTDAGQVAYVQASMDAGVPFLDGVFDAVFFVYSAYYAADPWRLLAETRRVLAPDGETCLVGPMAGNGVELDAISTAVFGAPSSPEKEARLLRLVDEFVPAAQAIFSRVVVREYDFSLTFPDVAQDVHYCRATPQFRELERVYGQRSIETIEDAVASTPGLRLSKRALVIAAGP